MKDLKDNSYDNLILGKIYLSEYSQFYRSIPILPDMKNSLMGKCIHASENYNNLLNSFSIITEYIKRDFVNLLFIVTDNYDKINEICSKKYLILNVNDYITPNINDDLTKIQYYLGIITQKQLEKKYKCINININTWDLYLLNNNNQNFLEYLKSNLIISSLCYHELIDALFYIIRYTNKDFVEMLKICVKNYNKIREICMNEKKQIIMNDLIINNVNDNQEKIKEYLNFICFEKIKDQYETINFDINIWKFYVSNKCNYEFLSFLENKLYESSLNSKEIFDCLDFSSNFRNKSFVPMLEIIFNNIDKIQQIFKNEKKIILIESYIEQQQKTDDLSKIYQLIKKIIVKEKSNTYCFIKFNINIWLPYTQCDKLETLKFIKKSIFECIIMEPELHEDFIQLEKKVYDIDFNEIKRGILKELLGENKSFFEKKN